MPARVISAEAETLTRIQREAGTDRESDPVLIDQRRTEQVTFTVEIDPTQGRDASRSLEAVIYVEAKANDWREVARFTWKGKPSRSVGDPDPNPSVILPASEFKGRRTKMRIINVSALEYAEAIE